MFLQFSNLKAYEEPEIQEQGGGHTFYLISIDDTDTDADARCKMGLLFARL